MHSDIDKGSSPDEESNNNGITSAAFVAGF
jgi:hypothetical protein